MPRMPTVAAITALLYLHVGFVLGGVIPLYRHNLNFSESVHAVRLEHRKVALKYGKGLNESMAEDLVKGPMPIDNKEMACKGGVSFGSSWETSFLQFDSGSSSLWVMDSSIGGGHHTYNAQRSTTYKYHSGHYGSAYGSGNPVSGQFATDNVGLGGFGLWGYTFGKVDHPGIFMADKFDGIFGLGWDVVEGPADVIQQGSPFQYLVNSRQMHFNGFTFKITFEGDKVGELTFGEKLNKNYNYIPSERGGPMWMLKFTGMKVGDQQISVPKWATVDSGTAMLLGDARGVQQVFNIIGARKYDSWSYMAPCSGLYHHNLYFNFGGHWLGINGGKLIMDKIGRDELAREGSAEAREALAWLGAEDDGCRLWLAPHAAAEDIWLFGEGFMKNWIIEFNWDTAAIGFANLDQEEGEILV